MDYVSASNVVIPLSTPRQNVDYLLKTLDRKLVNLESHQLLWLASYIKPEIVSIEALREIIDYTQLFEDIETCEQFINGSKSVSTFLIISDEMSQIMLPHIHNHDWVLKIYIHNTTSEENSNKCSSTYPKVSTHI